MYPVPMEGSSGIHRIPVTKEVNEKDKKCYEVKNYIGSFNLKEIQ